MKLLSENTKRNISNGNKKSLLNRGYVTYKDAIINGLIFNPNNLDVGDHIISLRKIQENTCKCVICSNEIKPIVVKPIRLSRSKTCSFECNKQLKINIGKISSKQIIDEGRHKGWQTRNILSYAEKFWIDVLINNDIKFIHNKPIKQENGISNYFLDFYIENNGKQIDLEIDGKQHNYDERKISDEKRDKFVTSQNIIVYRIKWNSINTNKGKLEMKNKIDNFLKFYKDV